MSDIIDQEPEESFDSEDWTGKNPTKLNNFNKQTTIKQQPLFLDNNRNIVKAMLEVAEQLSKSHK